MKNYILAALALTVATPALAANDNLAASVGVESNGYSVEQLVQLKGLEGDTDGRVYLGASAPANATAQEIFAEQEAEQRNGTFGYAGTQASRSVSSPVAESVFSVIDAE
ncbi:hypothetical protein FHY55_03460 [Oceanicola sp. D3]|uniref:hypothetical protein n=1 Tax=Oceanicola sp. D3 TaxID=2587163 RepID=UPI001120DE90|nr:hypothetical protein [Oceanicola sp. D3]QDC08356.1 hypothetical protein FHY55_03460 [Oceanicola sp. D3]